MDKKLYPTHYKGCNYLSMVRSKVIPVSNRPPEVCVTELNTDHASSYRRERCLIREQLWSWPIAKKIRGYIDGLLRLSCISPSLYKFCEAMQYFLHSIWYNLVWITTTLSTVIRNSLSVKATLLDPRTQIAWCGNIHEWDERIQLSSWLLHQARNTFWRSNFPAGYCQWFDGWALYVIQLSGARAPLKSKTLHCYPLWTNGH